MNIRPESFFRMEPQTPEDTPLKYILKYIARKDIINCTIDNIPEIPCAPPGS